MARYARIDTGRVAEIVVLPEGTDPAEAFHATVAATLVACPDPAVVEGWSYSDASKTFAAPVVAPRRSPSWSPTRRPSASRWRPPVSRSTA